MAAGTTFKVALKKEPHERLGLGCASTKKGDVRISSLAGAAARQGQLKVGDIIKELHKHKIGTLKDVSEAMKAWNNTGELVIAIVRPAEAAELGKAEVTSFTTDILINDYEEGDPMGVFIDKSFFVTKVVAGSPADGKFQLGDKVLAVAGWPLKDEQEFYMKLMRSAPQCIVKVERKGVPGQAVKPAAQQSKDAPNFDGDSKISTIDVEWQKDQPLGVVPDESLEIVRVQEGTVGAKYFHVGDIIMKINGQDLTDVNHLHDLIEKWPGGVMKVTINESVARRCSAEVTKLPDNIEKMIQRHAGFEYRIVEMVYDERSGKPYGLSLGNCAHNQVVVMTLKEGSAAAEKFKVYDRVLMINGTPVTDENVAKEYICAAGGNFQAVVERPATPERWAEIKTKAEQFKQQKASRGTKAEDSLATDAMLIAANYANRRKARSLKAAKVILKANAEDPKRQGRRLTFNEQRNVVEIVSDVPPGKQLRRCG